MIHLIMNELWKLLFNIESINARMPNYWYGEGFSFLWGDLTFMEWVYKENKTRQDMQLKENNTHTHTRVQYTYM